jgi:acyl-homoserine-lactone acylase
MLADDESITFDELLAYKHSTHVEAADRLVDDLVAAARESSDELVQEAADVLANWNRNTDADSRGAVLFIFWFESYTGQQGFDIFSVPFDINDPFNTPSGLSDPAGAVVFLREVAAHVQREYGALDVPYGDVMRLRVGEYDLPGNGGGDPSGVFRVAWYEPDGAGTYQLIGGDSFVSIVEFSDPINARVIVGQGNATQPGNPHVGDQLALFAAKEMREPWLTREAIEANLEAHHIFE